MPQAAEADIPVGAVNSAIGTDSTSAAWESATASPCQVGFLPTAPGAPFDAAIFDGFSGAIDGTDASIVAEGDSQSSRQGGFTALQQMLTAQPDIDVLVGPEQSLLGGPPSIEAAALDHEVLLVGVGGTRQGFTAIEDGTLYGTSLSAPRSEGAQALRDLLAALEAGEPQLGTDVVESSPNGGLVDQGTADPFTPESDA